MEQSPNFLKPETPVSAKPPHLSMSHWLVSVLAIIAAVCFFLVSYAYGLWPFGDLISPLPAISPKPTPQIARAYSNDQFGFSIDLPDSWQGYTVNQIKEDIYDITGQTTTNSGVVDSVQIIELHHPQETAQNPREDIPIMIFTLEQWMHIHNEEWSVGAAPIPPTLLGQNSQWIMALPARYNFDYKPGWEEVDQLVHTLKAFEPQGGTLSERSDVSNWKTYTNTQYGFEFRYPGDIFQSVLNENKELKNPSGVQLVDISGNFNNIFISIYSSPLDPSENIDGSPLKSLDSKKLGGKDAFGYSYGDAGCLQYRVKSSYNDSQSIEMTFLSCSGADWTSGDVLVVNDDQKLLDLILSTFKFTK